MASIPQDQTTFLSSECLLVYPGRSATPQLGSDLKRRFPQWQFTESFSYLQGIVEAASHDFDVVMAVVDPTHPQLHQAVAGLRSAGSSKHRLLLTCTPDTEPLARRMLGAGADDYVLYPFDARELDQALGLPHVDTSSPGVPSATMEELQQLSQALECLAGRPKVLLQRIADLVRLALGARGAIVVVQDATATSGEAVTSPVLSAPLTTAAGTIGQISVIERADRPYSPGDAAKLEHYASVIANLFAAASAQERWHQLAMTDECSGLPNRRFLHEKLDLILEHAVRDHLQVSVLLFDVDDFKSFNDRFGHDTGDQIIRTVGNLFRKNCREQDIVARYGGDEFAVVFWDPHGPRVAGSEHPGCALTVFDRVKAALREVRIGALGDQCAELTISGGLATFPWDASKREALLAKADQALLSAKRGGKNRIYHLGVKPERDLGC